MTIIRSNTTWICVICACLASMVVLSKRTLEEQLGQMFANYEALSQTEGAVISCSAGRCGKCFYEKTAFPYYRCIWSGIPSDNCSCDKWGYTLLP